MNKKDKLFEIIGTFLDEKNRISIDLETNLDDLALDSMDTFQFLMEIDKAFNVEIKIDQFIQCKKLQDILNLVNYDE